MNLYTASAEFLEKAMENHVNEEHTDRFQRTLEFPHKLTKGSVCTIAKGAVVRSTNPSKGSYVLKRDQKVTVHAFYEGYPDSCGYPGRPPEVHWAGTGGYWCWTDVSNVLTLEP